MSAAETAALQAELADVRQRLDDLKEAVLCLARPEPAPAEPCWPPPGYPPSRRHGLRLVKGGVR